MGFSFGSGSNTAKSQAAQIEDGGLLTTAVSLCMDSCKLFSLCRQFTGSKHCTSSFGTLKGKVAGAGMDWMVFLGNYDRIVLVV